MAFQLVDPVTANLVGVLDLRTRQHGLIVANLANADTPHYRARRLDFREALTQHLVRGGAVARTHGAHLHSQGPDDRAVRLVEAPPWAMDGNSVDPQRELAVLTENQLLYSASVEILNRRMGMLRYAINEGR